MSSELKVFDERVLLGKKFRVFGTKEEPIFLVKDVAEWIEHNKPQAR
jgi:anti-repressor protein